MLDLLFQLSPPPIPSIPTKKWHCHSCNCSGVILDFAFSLISHIQSIALIVRFPFEVYAESDPFLPTLLLPSWPKPLAALISTTARATSLVFSPVSSLQPEWSFKNVRSPPSAVHFPVSSRIKPKVLAMAYKTTRSGALQPLSSSLTFLSLNLTLSLFHSRRYGLLTCSLHPSDVAPTSGLCIPCFLRYV